MTIDEEIGTFLNADSGIVALIGAGNVWLCKLPEGAKKGIVYQQISGPRETTLDMRSQINARWQFASYAETPILARQINDAILAALEFFRGSLTEGGAFIGIDAAEDERGPLFDYERNLYRFDCDLILDY